jgi:hypothetical protein
VEQLHGLSFRGVQVTGAIDLISKDAHERLARVLGTYQSAWPRRSIDKLGLHVADGYRQHVSLEIEFKRRRDPGGALFEFESHTFSPKEELTPSTRRRQQQTFEDIKDILAQLAGFQLKESLHCHIVWIFKPDSKKPIIALPMMTMQNLNTPFSEISGVRFRDRGKMGVTSVIVDMSPDRSLTVSAVMHLEGLQISVNLLDCVVGRAHRVLDDYIMDVDVQSLGKEE